MSVLTSESGKRMLGYVAPVYYSSLVMQAIFQATGTEVDDLQQWTAEIRDQLFPQRATWGLPYWEYVLGLPTNNSTPIEKRRQAILSKMVTRIPITPAKIRQIAERDTGKTARVENRISPYTFRVTIESDGSGVDLAKLNEAMNYAKPAHLTAEYGIAYSVQIEINCEAPVIGQGTLSFASNRLYCGTWPDYSVSYICEKSTMKINVELTAYSNKFNFAGDIKCSKDGAVPDKQVTYIGIESTTKIVPEITSCRNKFDIAGTIKCSKDGAIEDKQVSYISTDEAVKITLNEKAYQKMLNFAGSMKCGEVNI
jgi:hypothetical protein